MRDDARHVVSCTAAERLTDESLDAPIRGLDELITSAVIGTVPSLQSEVDDGTR
jgi:hypothetical protein